VGDGAQGGQHRDELAGPRQDEQVRVSPHVRIVLERFGEQMRNPILRADAAYALNPRDQRLRPLALDGDARDKPLRTVDPQALEGSGGAEQDGVPAGHLQQGIPEVGGRTERRSCALEQQPQQQLADRLGRAAGISSPAHGNPSAPEFASSRAPSGPACGGGAAGPW